MKISKSKIAKFIKWSTSRYNEYSKADVVKVAFEMLTGKRQDETWTVSCGSFTPSSDMTMSGQYHVNGKEKYIARVKAVYNSDTYKYEVVEEYERLQF